jgi:hypothetical protein
MHSLQQFLVLDMAILQHDPALCLGVHGPQLPATASLVHVFPKCVQAGLRIMLSSFDVLVNLNPLASMSESIENPQLVRES